MSTRPSPAYKRATDSFYQLWGNIKQNVTQQSQLKGAIYNFVIVAVVASCVAVCLVLGPFLKPLLWALLVGAVLFPFKYQLSTWLKRWFQRIQENETHLCVGIVLAPLEAVETFGEYLWTSFMKHMQILISGAFGLICLRLFIAYAPSGLFCLAWRYIRWMHSTCGSFLDSLDYKIVSTYNESICIGMIFSRCRCSFSGDCHIDCLCYRRLILLERREITLFYVGRPEFVAAVVGLCLQFSRCSTSPNFDRLHVVCIRWFYVQYKFK